MSRAPAIVPPGRNKILAAAWKGHKAAQKAEGKKKPEPAEPTPAKKPAAKKKARAK
jgi:hypothetical protein